MEFFKNPTVKKYLSKTKLAIVDVGALGGIQDRWKEMSSHICFYGFEPQEKDSLVDPGVGGVLSVGLSNKSGQENLHVTVKKDASSLLMPDHISLERFVTGERYTVVSSEVVQVDTLDSQVNKHSIPYVDFLKIDTQGSELDVLRGSLQTINRCVLGVEVEVNLISRYKNQAYFSDVDQFLRSNGFEIIDFSRRFMSRSGTGTYQYKGQITHGTALYLRSTKYFRAMFDACGDQEKSALVIRYASLAFAYGYLDIVGEIMHTFSHAFAKEEFLIIEKTLKEKSKRHFLSGLPIVPRMRNFLYKILKFMESVEKRPQVGDSMLGN